MNRDRDNTGRFIRQQDQGRNRILMCLIGIFVLLPWIIIVKNRFEFSQVEDFFFPNQCLSKTGGKKSSRGFSGFTEEENDLLKNVGFPDGRK